MKHGMKEVRARAGDKERERESEREGGRGSGSEGAGERDRAERGVTQGEGGQVTMTVWKRSLKSRWRFASFAWSQRGSEQQKAQHSSVPCEESASRLRGRTGIEPFTIFHARLRAAF